MIFLNSLAASTPGSLTKQTKQPRGLNKKWMAQLRKALGVLWITSKRIREVEIFNFDLSPSVFWKRFFQLN